MHSQPTGYCECGCGEQTPLARSTRSAKRGGHKKGQPLRFLPGHQHLDGTPAYIVEDRGHTTPCWIWQRAKTHNGYAQRYATRHLGNTKYVHVQNWVDRRGTVPNGMDLDHLCRNRDCVNPDHLEPVPHAVNIQRGANAKITLEDAAAIRTVMLNGGNARSTAAEFGVSESLVYAIKHGHSWANAAQAA